MGAFWNPNGGVGLSYFGSLKRVSPQYESRGSNIALDLVCFFEENPKIVLFFSAPNLKIL